MKVLFVNKFLDKYTIYREPLGIMSLAAAIHPRHESFIADPSRDNIFTKIEKIRPDVIAYSLRSGFHQQYIDLNRKLKKKYEFFSVFGGPHPTFFPSMIEEEGVDAICQGEGEEAFMEYLDAAQNGKDTTIINNFWVKKDGKIHKNPCRPLRQDLDGLALPARWIFNNYRDIREAKIHSFMAGRGCPFNCIYCFNAEFKKMFAGQRFVRTRSVQRVIEEVLEVQRNTPFEIARFEDDTFNTDKEWLREFSQEFRKTGLKLICTGIWAGFVDEEVVQLLKDANCISVSFGIEAGSGRVRRDILERKMTDEQIITTARLFRKYGIFYVTENIMAIPDTTLEDDLKTLEINIKCKTRYPVVSIMQPYPGTKIYQLAMQHKLLEENIVENLPISFYDKTIFNIDHKRERENLQKLFAIVVRFPSLFKYIRSLIALPLGPLYSFFYNTFKGYVGAFEYSYARRSLREYICLLRRYVTS